MNNDTTINHRAGFMTRTTVVSLQVSLDAIEDIALAHYYWMGSAFSQRLPLTEEEYVEYCKSLLAYKLNLVANKKGVPSQVKTAVMPSFLEHMISRIGEYRDNTTGIVSTFVSAKHKPLSGEDIAKFSMCLAGIRRNQCDLVFEGFDSRINTALENLYVVENDKVYGVIGTEPKGYQLAAALAVTPVHPEHYVLFRKELCSVPFAKQEVANVFG